MTGSGDDLTSRLENALDDAATAAPAETASVEWNGTEGTIFTGAVGDDFDPNDAGAVLAAHGFDPSTHGIELTKAKRWEQRNRIRGTADYERSWLHSFAYRVFRKQGADIDLPALYAEVRRTKPAKLKAKKREPAEVTTVVAWADVQTGKVDHLGGISELLVRLDEKRAALDKYLRAAGSDHIVVCDVGDILEGFDNVASQVRTNGLSLQDQVDVAATEFWRTIKLCAKYGDVDVLSIPSNHCQWRRGKDLVGRPGDDWGIHISRRLEALNAEVGLPVTFHRPEDDYSETLQFDVRGTRLGLAHGHQSRSPDGVRTWWEKMTHAGVLDVHVLLTGHYHFASLRPHGRDAVTGKARWHIQAPTLDNGSAWVKNKLGEDGDPALAVFQIGESGFDVSSFALL